MHDLSWGHLAQIYRISTCSEEVLKASDKLRQQVQAALDQPDDVDAARFDGSVQPSEMPKVYIIDDDRSVRRALTRLLATMGMEIHAFESAEAFLTDLDKLSRGSMIVDIQLAGMDGLELLDMMARAGKRWPAVVISGSLAGHEDAVTLELGPDRYLRKPFDVNALLRALSCPGQWASNSRQ